MLSERSECDHVALETIGVWPPCIIWRYVFIVLGSLLACCGLLYLCIMCALPRERRGGRGAAQVRLLPEDAAQVVTPPGVPSSLASTR